jgi:hypothetical protein
MHWSSTPHTNNASTYRVEQHQRCVYIQKRPTLVLGEKCKNGQGNVNPPGRSNQIMDCLLVRLYIFREHLNCFPRTMLWSQISREARPTVRSESSNRRNTNNTKPKKENHLLLAHYHCELAVCTSCCHDLTAIVIVCELVARCCCCCRRELMLPLCCRCAAVVLPS